MSVHPSKSGGYEVRWEAEGRQRSKSFPRGKRREAEIFDGKIKERKALGDLAFLDAGRETLDTYVQETWWPTHANALADNTRRTYAWHYDALIEPRLGAVPLREIQPETVARFQADLIAAGTGAELRKKAMMLLGGILQRAAEARRIPYNPARLVRKVPVPPAAEVRPLAPASVEALRAAMALDDEGKRRSTAGRDSMVVSLLAYAGLRPQELRGLRWVHVGKRTLLVNAEKTRKRRTVRLLAPLAADLAEWRMASGRPADRGWIIPGDDGERWTDQGFAKWRGRVFNPARKRAGIDPEATPYTLRHSFASLLLHEGRNVIYVARQLGHGADLTLKTYGHVIDELEDAPNLAAEEAIRQARNARGPSEILRRRGPANG